MQFNFEFLSWFLAKLFKENAVLLGSVVKTCVKGGSAGPSPLTGLTMPDQ